MNALHGPVQLHDDALARSPALRGAMPAVAQAGVRGFADQRYGLGTAGIQHRNNVAGMLAVPVAVAAVLAVAATVAAHECVLIKQPLALSLWPDSWLLVCFATKDRSLLCDPQITQLPNYPFTKFSISAFSASSAVNAASLSPRLYG